MAKDKKIKLDAKEQEISELLERGELKSVPNAEEERAVAQQAASEYLKRDQRVSVRLSQQDLDSVKHIAAEEGLPYQTFLASVIHKVATGKIRWQS